MWPVLLFFLKYIYIYIYIYSIYIYIYIYIYIRGAYDKFPDFVRRRHLKIQYVIAIHHMRLLTNFYDFSFKWTARAGVEMHPTKAWLSQLVNFKMQSETFEERYAIKFCFKLGKNATETYGILQTAFRPSCMNQASVFEWHKILNKDRESMRDDERCGRSKEVRTQELGLRLVLLC